MQLKNIYFRFTWWIKFQQVYDVNVNILFFKLKWDIFFSNNKRKKFYMLLKIFTAYYLLAVIKLYYSLLKITLQMKYLCYIQLHKNVNANFNTHFSVYHSNILLYIYLIFLVSSITKEHFFSYDEFICKIYYIYKQKIYKCI